MYVDPTLVSTVNNGSTETKPSTNVQTTKSMEPSPKKIISSIEQKLKQSNIENLLVIKSLYENMFYFKTLSYNSLQRYL